MKLIFVTLFFGMCSLAFGNNTNVKKNFIETNKVDVVTPIKIRTKKKTKMKQPRTMVAFEYYYTVDWLYAETPFSHKLEAYA